MDELNNSLGRYVHKVLTDNLIVRALKNPIGISYLDVISPDDIAYAIAFVKNGKEIWDQYLCLSATGEAAMAYKEPKLKLKFTKGKVQKRSRENRLWNKEGMSFSEWQRKF